MLKLVLLSALLLALHTPAPSELVRHDHAATIVEIDPAAYRVDLYKGKADPCVLSFNANYYDPLPPHKVIGVLMTRGNYAPYLYDRTVDTRPCLTITKRGKAFISRTPWLGHRKEMDVAVQGGPTLVEKSHIAHVPGEHMASDTLRTTEQLSVGTTAIGKLYVIYSHGWSIRHIAETFLALHCTDAMKLDGGHSAHLYYDGINRGNANVMCGVVFRAK